MTRTRRTYVIAAAVAAIVTAANASQGAYFSQSWGWVALAFLVPTTVLLILDRVETPSRLRVAFAALMVALGIWIALSSLWSISTSASIREVERMLVYVAVALALALILRRGDAAGVTAGAVLGVALVCGYALATRLFPDRIESSVDAIDTDRLAAPVGYWNALGLLAVLGLLAALGFVAHARRLAAVAAAAATLPAFAMTLYFTFSRGAWAALAIGLVSMVALDPRRLRLLVVTIVVAAPSALAIAYASQRDALTTEHTPLTAATGEGHRVAFVLAAAMLLTATLSIAARKVARRVDVSQRARRVFDGSLVAVALLSVVVVVLSVGGPRAVVTKLEDGFNSEPVSASLNKRVFSLSGTGRSEQLRVAWDAGRDRPLAGNGAGTFEYLWYERRPNLLVVRDGHSLYMETFAELGLVGLALLVTALLLLLVAGARARRTRFVASGTGALLGWMAASAFDWHWEVVGVTLTALLAGSAGLLASESMTPRLLRSRPRGALVGLAVALSVLAVWSLVGNQALFAGREALAREDWTAAKDTRDGPEPCFRGRTSPTSSSAMRKPAAEIEPVPSGAIETQFPRILGTGSRGSISPRSRKAESVRPRMSACTNSIPARRGCRASDAPKTG